jgi:hypothetical protein
MAAELFFRAFDMKPGNRNAENHHPILLPERIVLGLLFAVTAVNHLDRQTLSVVAPLLRKQL